MTFSSKTLMATTIVSALSFPLTTLATNGMNAEGNGAKSRGMGGAGVAMAVETASTITNPAAVTGLGNRLDFALGIFSPKPRSYKLEGNPFGFDNAQESDSNYFAIPFFGYNKSIDDKSAYSIVVNANGGMNTDYKTNFGATAAPAFGGPKTGRTGINLEQLFTNFTYGRKINSNMSYGITAIIAYQRFEATGLDSFDNAATSSSPGSVTNNGTDTSTGFGIKLGFSAKVSKGLSIGAAIQPKIDMSEFDKYKGLFPDAGDLDIAPTYTLGMSWNANSKTVVAIDYHYIDYEAVDTISNSTSLFNSTVAPGTDVLFGTSGGPGFGWRSINVWKMGVAYDLSNKWTYRMGWNHGDNPILPEEVSVNFLASAVTEDHLTFGFTNKLDKKSELTFDFVHSFKNSVTGDFSPSFGGGDMTIEMEQNFVELAYSKKL